MHFSVEITRNCNLQCGHCLRGPRQKKSMSYEHIVKAVELIESFDDVDVMAVTGGEPLLEIEKTIQFLSLFDDDRYFFLSTSATMNIDEEKLALLIISMGSSGHIQISDDLHHRRMWGSRREFYVNKLKDFLDRNDVEYSCTKGFGNRLIKEGRAKDFGSLDPEGSDVVYINALGEILIGCNWSYASQKERVLTTLDDDNHRGVLLRHLRNESLADRLERLHSPNCVSCPLPCKHLDSVEQCYLNIARWLETGDVPTN